MSMMGGDQLHDFSCNTVGTGYMRNILTNLDLRKSVGIDNISLPATSIGVDHYRRNNLSHQLFNHDSVNTHLVEGQ